MPVPSESPNEFSSWFLAAAALFAAVGAIAAWLLVVRARRLEEKLERLAKLDDVAAQVTRLAERDEELDLRRLEHVLIDIRDGQRRVEDRLLALLESRARAGDDAGRATSVSAEPDATLPATHDATGAALSDRVVSRLLSLGYERIVLVTPSAELGRIAREGGAIVVEARRDGAACKGRVLVADGRIHDLQIQSAYSTFP